jgi:hypothetical protein
MHFGFSFHEFQHAEIASLLAPMGLVNGVATLTFSTVAAKVAASRHRRIASTFLVLAWMSLVLVAIDYAFDIVIFGSTLALAHIGLVIWLFAFFAVSVVIVTISRTSVQGPSVPGAKRLEFKRTFNAPDFGVPFIDDALATANALRVDIFYPMLLVHDRLSPGFSIGMHYVRAGIASKEAVIYITFSRPWTIVQRQLAARAGYDDLAAPPVFIIDCYSRAYMSDQVPSWFERIVRKVPRRPRIFFADPRDPADVYKKYIAALRLAHEQAQSCRTIYETLSDFIKVADFELVTHYLRRMVVFEELINVKALYLFWEGTMSDATAERYLFWFFSTAMRMQRKDQLKNGGKYKVEIERLFPNNVSLVTDDSLRPLVDAVFRKNEPRIESFARLAAALQYKAQPYNFLPFIPSDDPGRRRHLAHFSLFMVAIDHNTHSADVTYEAELDGVFFHGSDLLYAMAQRAKSHDQALFLPEYMRSISNDEVASVFTPPRGKAPADTVGRAEIFRALAGALNERCGGDFLNLLDACHGRIAGPEGLLSRLREFPGFADPVEKKANLLCKLLIREHVFHAADRDAIDIAIDHVVITMALRSGLIECLDPAIMEQVSNSIVIDEYALAKLRGLSKLVLRDVARRAKLFPDELDDLLWSYGRKSLRQATPLESPADVRSELDPFVNPLERSDFVAFLNGVDPGARPEWSKVETIRFPFTRYF